MLLLEEIYMRKKMEELSTVLIRIKDFAIGRRKDKKLWRLDPSGCSTMKFLFKEIVSFPFELKDL